ncbi:MAG: OmpA family protein [Bacteroidia bacterium]|nr:OmpA family protein [Bacteroidia bacterium]
MKIFWISLMFFLFAGAVVAQKQSDYCLPSENKKAIKFFEDALKESKDNRDYDKIKKYVYSAAETDTTYAAPWRLLGDIAYRKDDFKTFGNAYARLIELCVDAGAETYYRLGNYYYGLKKYEQAQKIFKAYYDQPNTSEKYSAEVDQKLFRIKLLLNPVPFNPVAVKGISTADPEYLANLSADNELCFFTRRYEEQSKGSLTPKNVEKFMLAHRLGDDIYDAGKPMPLPFNKSVSGNEGGACISLDNQHLYFTVNEKGNFDIWESQWNGKSWSELNRLSTAINHPKQWDAQPCLTADGNTLYFATFRDSINRTSDIYYSTRNADKSWSQAKPLKYVNTNGNEKSPFMHPDNTTFFFSSDSLPGMGGYDIYMVKIDSAGKWSKPYNVGYPINTEADEVGFFISTDGKLGYFASDKIKLDGGFDIYSFKIHDKIKPDKVLLLKGNISADDSLPNGALLELKNMRTKEIMHLDYDTITGRFAKVVAFDNDFMLTVKKEGYAFNSVYFAANDTNIKPQTKATVELKKIEVGQTYQLNNILYQTNSSVLDSSSMLVLQDFAQFLRESPKVQIAIHGHTDTEGNAIANLNLSMQRAKTVYEYLIKSGIQANRLTYKGFGQSQPKASNETEQGRTLNRRTEFLITAK